MKSKSTIYPYVNDTDVQRIRKMKKEDIVAYVCFLGKRNDIFDAALKQIAHFVTDTSYEEFRLMIVKIINKIFISNLRLIKEYENHIKEIDTSTQVVVHNINFNKVTLDNDGNFDLTDINIQ